MAPTAPPPRTSTAVPAGWRRATLASRVAVILTVGAWGAAAQFESVVNADVAPPGTVPSAMGRTPHVWPDAAALAAHLGCGWIRDFEVAAPAIRGYVCHAPGGLHAPVTIFVYRDTVPDDVVAYRLGRVCRYAAAHPGREAYAALGSDWLAWTLDADVTELIGRSGADVVPITCGGDA